MTSSTREQIAEVLEGYEEYQKRLCALTFDGLTTPEWLRVLERLKQIERRHPVPRHALVNLLAEQATGEELGAKLHLALANRLRISPNEARRWIVEAQDLGQRRALTGEPLAPKLIATAQAQRDGHIGEEHVRVVRTFFSKLPGWVDLATRESVEARLANKATEHRPDELTKLANKTLDCLNPDGDYTDEDRARRRGVTLGPQGDDGMSRISGYVNPEARATIEALFNKLAAPGMCNPDDDTPCVDGPPAEDAVRRDTRSSAQRNHDALVAAGRTLLCSGALGQHNGLPTAIIVTTTLDDLEAAAGQGLTGDGTLLPMNDVIRLARHARHYLASFDKGKAIALYHSKRLASPGQRIVLYAKDRGCTKPGCDAPGYRCEVHHVQGWAGTRCTDIDQLTFACGPDNRLVENGWVTRNNSRGETEWIPPAHFDHGQPRVNSFHHPEKLLREGDDDDEPA